MARELVDRTEAGERKVSLFLSQSPLNAQGPENLENANANAFNAGVHVVNVSCAWTLGTASD